MVRRGSASTFVTSARSRACVRMPLSCLGAAVEIMCDAFVVTDDALLLADGQQCVRLPTRVVSRNAEP